MMPFTVFHESGVAMLVPPNLHAMADEKPRLLRMALNCMLPAMAWHDRRFTKVDSMIAGGSSSLEVLCAKIVGPKMA
jgi:hypothetical protein